MYFEDFHTGLQITTDSRSISTEELDSFLDLTGLHLPMFLDDLPAREHGHARRLVTGPMIVAVALGLARARGCFDHVIAGLEFTQVRFLKAVHPGDSIHAKITVAETRPSSDTKRGLIVLDINVMNQAGATVLTMKGTYLFARRCAD